MSIGFMGALVEKAACNSGLVPDFGRGRADRLLMHFENTFYERLENHRKRYNHQSP